ncbi:hypothetical protein N7486_007746 [Penicillium sp. IBT 16267x]|nr:hypothetical protein N7486_007746 [Penicillium sp. IBT 16267x]
MFRRASLPFPSLHGLKSARFTRYFHRVTTDYIDYDSSGKVALRKVSIIVGNPGETYVLIDPGVGTAIRAASPFTSPSAASAEGRCKLTFFHDSQHFGFGRSSSRRGSSSYPRLYVPSQMPRQTESNTSSATLFLSGKMHEIVLDETLDCRPRYQPTPGFFSILIHHVYLAKFAENATATGRHLETVLRQLRDI